MAEEVPNAPPLELLSVAVPRPLDGLFTYLLPERLRGLVPVGGWVKVPFGRTTTHAFVVEPPKPMSALPEGLKRESLREILDVGSSEPVFSEDILELCRWASDYYCSPLGEVLAVAAPPAALGMKSKRQAVRAIVTTHPPIVPHALNDDQRAALCALEVHRDAPGSSRVELLHGVTGSGKTEVYLELARRALAQGRGVLLLVPEIALTTQLHQRFEENLGTPVALWHSAVADGRRRDLGAALRSGEIRVVVGARSAVFAPIRELGLIVIDEEHDPTYKQDDRVRYHARDLAIVRAKRVGAQVVLGSATPCLETRERVREGRFGLARLDTRIAVGGEPKVEIVNLCEAERVENTQAPLAVRTIEVLRETLAAGEQAMIFLNRRGFASFLICQDCGEVKRCGQCSISLTVHKQRKELKCHVCGAREPIPDACTKCNGASLDAVGAGTESLELDLPGLVEGLQPLRLDRDQVTSATRLEKILSDFRARKANVLLGTQMLAKGHDFPGVTLVIVVLADALFRWPDFRAPERAYQILKQVAGRAGRGDRPGRVLVQAFDVEHPVLQTLQGKLDERSFLEGERELRQALHYPPFGRMARLRFESPDREAAISRAQGVARELQRLIEVKSLPVAETAIQPVELLGPSEAFLEKAKGIYRWDILLKSREVQPLRQLINRARQVCAASRTPFVVDVDPYGAG